MIDRSLSAELHMENIKMNSNTTNNITTTDVNPFVQMALTNPAARLALRKDALTQQAIVKQAAREKVRSAKEERRQALKGCYDAIQAAAVAQSIAEQELKAAQKKLSAAGKTANGLSQARDDAARQGMTALANLVEEQITQTQATILQMEEQVARIQKTIATKKGAVTKAQNKLQTVQEEMDEKVDAAAAAAEAAAESEMAQHPAVIAWNQTLRLLERDMLSRAEYVSLRDLIAEAREIFAEDLAQQLQFLDDKRRMYGRRVDALAQAIAIGELIPGEPVPAKTAYILARGERILAVDKKGNELFRWVIGDQGRGIFAVPAKDRYWKLHMDGGTKKGVFQYTAKPVAAKPASTSKKTITAKPVAAPKVVQPAAAKPAARKNPQTKKELLHIIEEQLQ